MPTAQSIMDTLKIKATEKTRATYIRHGLPPDHTLGVSIADLKLIAKTIKGQQPLACDLYATGVMDAMYLAGIVASGTKMSRSQIEAWGEGAAGMPMIIDHTVPWVTVEHPDARIIAFTWIPSPGEHLASAGWRSYAGLVTTQPDQDLDLTEVDYLLTLAQRASDDPRDRVRSAMNGFVISVGTYVQPLLARAKQTARAMGEVQVDVGDTACKVPVSLAYIEKSETMNRIGKKRKTIRC
jgi:3-methyladenine DNA glycosylase AlkD